MRCTARRWWRFQFSWDGDSRWIDPLDGLPDSFRQSIKEGWIFEGEKDMFMGSVLRKISGFGFKSADYYEESRIFREIFEKTRGSDGKRTCSSQFIAGSNTRCPRCMQSSWFAGDRWSRKSSAFAIFVHLCCQRKRRNTRSTDLMRIIFNGGEMRVSKKLFLPLTRSSAKCIVLLIPCCHRPSVPVLKDHDEFLNTERSCGYGFQIFQLSSCHDFFFTIPNLHGHYISSSKQRIEIWMSSPKDNEFYVLERMRTVPKLCFDCRFPWSLLALLIRSGVSAKVISTVTIWNDTSRLWWEFDVESAEVWSCVPGVITNGTVMAAIHAQPMVRRLIITKEEIELAFDKQLKGVKIFSYVPGLEDRQYQYIVKPLSPWSFWLSIIVRLQRPCFLSEARNFILKSVVLYFILPRKSMR